MIDQAGRIVELPGHRRAVGEPNFRFAVGCGRCGS
jgi:hypothetical protein